MGLRVWVWGISCLVALMRLAASFYDNLNQFPASQKERHEFKMRSQLHNQCKELLKRRFRFLSRLLWSPQHAVTQFQIWCVQCWSNLNEMKQSICLSLYCYCFVPMVSPRHSLKLQWLCVGFNLRYAISDFYRVSIVDFEFYSLWLWSGCSSALILSYPKAEDNKAHFFISEFNETTCVPLQEYATL